MTDGATDGGCLCGAVRFRLRGDPFWVSYCHCGDCRKASGGAFMVFAGYRREQVEMLGAGPAVHSSSTGVRRSFCAECGTPMAYEHEALGGEIYLHIGTIDGAEALAPVCHAWDSQRLPWLELADDLPRHPGNSRPRPAGPG